jgi:hypothetical protein
MKTTILPVLLVSSCLVHHSALAQGSLIPLGAPAPTMKTLDQIEPRTVITNLPWTASAPGAYVVSRNLSLTSGIGISVTASDVTIDLNGFVLTGSTGGGGHGIQVASGLENVTIQNGVLRNWGGDGIHARGTDNLRIDNLRVHGCTGDGIEMSRGTVSRIVSSGNGGAGLRPKNDPIPGIDIIVEKKPSGPVKLVNNGGGGVVAEGPGSIQFGGGDISGNTNHGISWVSAEAGATFRLSLDGVTCDDNTGDGVHVDLSGAAARTFLSVRNISSASQSRVSGNGGHGVSVAMGAANVFLNIDGVEGEFSNNGGDGIRVNTPGAGTQSKIKNDIDGKEVKYRADGNGGNGMTVIANAVDMFLDLKVGKGEFVNNGGHGMYVEGGSKGAIDLDGGTFSGNTQSGLRVINEEGIKASPVKGIAASHNGSHGIHIQSSGVWRFSGCRAADNGGDGIRAERPVAGTDRWGELIFETNDLVANGGAGLNIPTNSTATVAGTILVTGGLVSGNTAAGIIIADNGVKPGSVNRVSVTGNGSHGIVVAGDDFRIEGNLVARNAGSGIRVTGTGAHLARNQCSGNVTGIEVTGLGNAVRENVFGGTAAQTPLNVTTPGNAVAPTQDVETGTNPLGNVGY